VGVMRPSRENTRGGLSLKQRARDLRGNLTDAERVLWRELRHYRLGRRFRRQFPIAPYIVDFACIEAGLIVEIDGGQHARPGDHDCRNAFLRRRGRLVLRFWNDEILVNRAGVVQTIAAALLPSRAEDPHPGPPPLAGEGVSLVREETC
jgi:very-short-patch-repair endonuclease